MIHLVTDIVQIHFLSGLKKYNKTTTAIAEALKLTGIHSMQYIWKPLLRLQEQSTY